MAVTKAVSSTLKEFRAFTIRGNAVDLAIGVAIGSAFTAVVQAIVGGLFTPLIAAIFGQPNFASLAITVNGSHIQYGLFINAIFTLAIVALTLFFLVVKPLNSLKRRLGIESASPALAGCPACLTQINVLARRCPSCTEPLSEEWASKP